MQLPVEPARYAAFLSVMAVMAIAPGPANVFAIATGMRQGKGAALLAVAGMNSATLIWFAGAALGLGALVAAFPQVFHVLTYLGVAYLAWLGLKSLMAAAKNAPDDATAPDQASRSALKSGFLVQIANPKVLLFFTAVLPPFVDVGRPLVPQMLLFAATTISMDVLSMTAYGLSGAALARRMNEPRFRRIFRASIGVLLLAAAAMILLRG